MDFSPAIEAQLSGKTVRKAPLIELMFASGTVYLWNGFRKLRTLDGRLWEGTKGHGQLTGLQQSFEGNAPQMTLELSAVDQRFITTAIGETDEYYDRMVRIWAQFFDADWQPLGLPYARQWGLMKSLTPSREAEEDGFSRKIVLNIESPFAKRRRPRHGFMTDRDQQNRFTGDRGCERVAGIQNRTIAWPDY